MSWPTANDYDDVVQNLRHSMSDEELRAGQAALDDQDLPMVWSGSFASVYRINCPATGKSWALKCFTRAVTTRQERYRHIAAHLQAARLPFAVPFVYMDRGIQVQGQWYPAVKMEWVEGQTLNRFVEESLEKPQMLRQLLDLWPKLATRLRDAGIAHADLQHGNVLLVPMPNGQLAIKLIDYDGMYVPALAGTKSGELGHAAYQHPQRARERTYTADVDRFSHLVIYTAVHCLKSGGRNLWQRFNNDDNLLFREEDFRRPAESELFRALWEIGDTNSRTLVGRLFLACGQPLATSPWLDQIIEGQRVTPLIRSEQYTVASQLAARPTMPVIADAPSLPADLGATTGPLPGGGGGSAVVPDATMIGTAPATAAGTVPLTLRIGTVRKARSRGFAAAAHALDVFFRRLVGEENDILRYFLWAVLPLLLLATVWVGVSALTPSPPPWKLHPVAAQTIEAGKELTVAVTVDNADSWQGKLRYRLGGQVPPGLVIDPRTGSVAWTPGSDQDPGNYDVDVLVDSSDGRHDATTLRVTVTPRPRESATERLAKLYRERFGKWRLKPVETQTVAMGELLRVSITPENTNVWKGQLRYSLEPNAPFGASVDQRSGEFSWTPTRVERRRILGLHEITVVATAADQVGKVSFIVKVTNVPEPEPPDAETVADKIERLDAGYVPSEPTELGVQTLTMPPITQEELARLNEKVGEEELLRRTLPDRAFRVSERAVALALNWSARHQVYDGSWSLDGYLSRCTDTTCAGGGMKGDTTHCATAMGLLPFLAAGQTHETKGPYQQTVFNGLFYLIKHQRPDGDLRDAGGMYTQGLASVCLCEAFGMSHDRAIGAAAQKAVNFIQSAQDKHAGGWDDKPGDPGDTLTTGWQIMALKSAQMAYLSVDPAVLERASQFLDSCALGKNKGNFSYQPGGGSSDSATATAIQHSLTLVLDAGGGSSDSATATGLLCRQYLGARRDDGCFREGKDFLMAHQPDMAQRNFYNWYYATQVMHNLTGPDWDAWNRKMRKVLIDSQCRQDNTCAVGSWNPEGATHDMWGTQGGRLMVTSLATLTLEVYYRYLPLFKLDNDPQLAPASSVVPADAGKVLPLTPPLKLQSIAAQVVESGKRLNVTVTPENADAWKGKLRYSLGPQAPPGSNIDPQSGEFSWTPPDKAASQYGVTVSAQSPNGQTAQTTFIITATRPIPIAVPATLSGKEITVDLGSGVKLEMVLVPAGEFQMGSPDSDIDADDREKPQHRVRITKPFYLGKYLVTQELWEAVIGNNPSKFKGPKNPMEQVSWDDCQQFLEKLNAKVGTQGGKFVLPTEAQWEYACRAGSTSRYCFGDLSGLGEYAWYDKNSGNKTHPVGEKKPNAWGLHDMHGNVWEWCQDSYDSSYYAKSPRDDPPGAATGSNRVCRGGSWFTPAWGCRSAFQGIIEPGFRRNDLGLRVSRVAE